MILLIDNQSRFIKKFKRTFLSEQDFDYIFFDHNQPIILSAKTKISGIILSGGKGNPYEPLNLTANFVAMMNFNVPVMGFCLGFEIVAVAYRGRIKRLPEYVSRKDSVRILKPEDKIFEGIEKSEVMLTKRHNFYVSELPPMFENLAESDTCTYEIIKHKTKPIYGFQSHPEASGEEGLQMVKNFLRMCKIDI